MSKLKNPYIRLSGENLEGRSMYAADVLYATQTVANYQSDTHYEVSQAVGTREQQQTSAETLQGISADILSLQQDIAALRTSLSEKANEKESIEHQLREAMITRQQNDDARILAQKNYDRGEKDVALIEGKIKDLEEKMSGFAANGTHISAADSSRMRGLLGKQKAIHAGFETAKAALFTANDLSADDMVRINALKGQLAEVEWGMQILATDIIFTEQELEGKYDSRREVESEMAADIAHRVSQIQPFVLPAESEKSAQLSPENLAVLDAAFAEFSDDMEEVNEVLADANNIMPHLSSQTAIASMQQSIGVLSTIVDTNQQTYQELVDRTQNLRTVIHTAAIETIVRFDGLEGMHVPEFSLMDIPSLGQVHVTTTTNAGVTVKDGVLRAADNGNGSMIVKLQNPTYVREVGLVHFDGYHGFGRLSASLNGQSVIDKNITPHERVVIDGFVDTIVLYAPRDNGFRDYTHLMANGISSITTVTSQEEFAASRITTSEDDITIRPDIAGAMASLPPQQFRQEFAEYLPEKGVYPAGIPPPVHRFNGIVNEGMNNGVTQTIVAALRSANPHSFTTPTGQELQQRFPNLSRDEATWRSNIYNDAIVSRSMAGMNYVLAVFNDDVVGMNTAYAELTQPAPSRLGTEIAAGFPRASAFIQASYTVLTTPSLCAPIDDAIAVRNFTEQSELDRQQSPTYAGGGSSATLDAVSLAGILHNRTIVAAQHGEGSAQIYAFDQRWGTAPGMTVTTTREDNRNSGRNSRLANAALELRTDPRANAVMTARANGTKSVVIAQQNPSVPNTIVETRVLAETEEVFMNRELHLSFFIKQGNVLAHGSAPTGFINGVVQYSASMQKQILNDLLDLYEGPSIMNMNGYLMNTDTQMGKIVMGIASLDLDEASTTEKQILAEKVSAITGIPSGSLFGIMRSNTRFYQGIVTLFSEAGYGYLFGQQQNSSSQNPLVSNTNATHYTDGMIHVTWNLPSASKPVSHASVYLIDHNGREVPTGETAFINGQHVPDNRLTGEVRDQFFALIPVDSLPIVASDTTTFSIKTVVWFTDGTTASDMTDSFTVLQNNLDPDAVDNVFGDIDDILGESVGSLSEAQKDALKDAFNFGNLDDLPKNKQLIEWLMENYIKNGEMKFNSNEWIGTPYEVPPESFIGECKWWVDDIVVKSALNIDLPSNNQPSGANAWLPKNVVEAISASTEGLASVFQDGIAKAGDIVQLTGVDFYPQHTFIVGAVTANGIWVFDANMAKPKTPAYHFIAFQQFNKEPDFTVYRIVQ